MHVSWRSVIVARHQKSFERGLETISTKSAPLTGGTSARIRCKPQLQRHRPCFAHQDRRARPAVHGFRPVRIRCRCRVPCKAPSTQRRRCRCTHGSRNAVSATDHAAEGNITVKIALAVRDAVAVGIFKARRAFPPRPTSAPAGLKFKLWPLSFSPSAISE